MATNQTVMAEGTAPRDNDRIDILNRVFDAHKDAFLGAFHSVLWEVLANNAFAGKVVAFVSNYTEHGNQLGIAVANERGYCPTPAYLKTMPRAEVTHTLDALNQAVFGLTSDTALDIVVSTMRNGS